MQTKYIIFILIYSLLSTFMSGMICREMWDEDVENFVDFCWFCLYAVIFTLVIIPIHLLDLIRGIIKWFKETLLIGFYFDFYFKHTFDKKDEKWLAEKNNMAINYFNTKSLHDRMYRYQIGLVNKRNNYTHVQTK